VAQRRIEHLRLVPSGPLPWNTRARSKLGDGGLLIEFAYVSGDDTCDLFDPLLESGLDLVHALGELLPEIEEQLLLVLQSPLHLVKSCLERTRAALNGRGRDLLQLCEHLRLVCDRNRELTSRAALKPV